MLNILLAAGSGGLVQLLIIIVVVGAIIYCVQLLPIAEPFKKIALVLGVVVIFIMAIRVLLPMAGL